MFAIYKHIGFNKCVVRNVYGWWMYESDGIWRKVWGFMHSAEPNDEFRRGLQPLRPLELLLYTGLSERKARMIGVPSSGVVYRGTDRY